MVLGDRMARLIMWNLMTLDGFVEGPGHDIAWHEAVWDDALEAFSIAQLKTAGGLLFGRRTYELMAAHWPAEEGAVAAYMNRLPKFAVSRTLTRVEWRDSRLIRADAVHEVARLKEAIDGDLFLFGSAHLAATLLPHGLFDELRLGIAPLTIGRGEPLFKPDAGRFTFRLAESRALESGVVILRYLPAGRDGPGSGPANRKEEMS